MSDETPLDLDAIRARNDEASKVLDEMTALEKPGMNAAMAISFALGATAADVPALLAEVERLRADITRLRAWLHVG